MRLVFCVLLPLCAACGSAAEGPIDPIDPQDPIDPPAATCDSESALQIWIDGVDYTPQNEIRSASSELATNITNNMEDGVAYNLVSLHFADVDSITSTSMPSASVEVEFGASPNGSNTPTVAVASYDPAAINWLQAQVEGAIEIVEQGREVGDTRCGSFDLKLSWDVVGGETRAARVRGVFAGEVLPTHND